MTLGGLKEGVSPLDMAHAYETFARKGKLTYGTMSPGTLGAGKPVPGPVGIRAIGREKHGKLEPVDLPDGEQARNRVKTRRVLDEGVANAVGTLLQGVVKNGTGKRAMLDPRIPVAGKTGTTENYGDAWFVGWTPEYTVAVWVGYPKKFQPMKTEFQGQPVAGGTFPAAIWKTFMESVFKIEPPPELKDTTPQDALPGATAVPGAAATAAPPVTPAPSTPQTPQTQGGGTTAPAKPQNPAPAPPANNQPSAPAPTTPQQGGGQTPPSGGTAPPAGGTG
jgi:penicillin-binding protein 1A